MAKIERLPLNPEDYLPTREEARKAVKSAEEGMKLRAKRRSGKLIRIYSPEHLLSDLITFQSR